MSDLKKLSDLANDLFDAQTKVDQLESDLRAAQQRVRDLSEVQIPELMDSAGVDEFTTSAGFKLRVKDKIRFGNLKSAALHEWLRQVGEGGLIKSDVAVHFRDGGDDERARALYQALQKKGLAAELFQTVAWNSLESSVRKMMEDGEPVPLDQLGGHIVRTTQLQLPKKQ